MKLSRKLVSAIAAGALVVGIAGVTTAQSASAATITTVKQTCEVDIGSNHGVWVLQPYKSITIWTVKNGREAPLKVSAGANRMELKVLVKSGGKGNCYITGRYTTTYR